MEIDRSLKASFGCFVLEPAGKICLITLNGISGAEGQWFESTRVCQTSLDLNPLSVAKNWAMIP
jgi:hypothetical protein